MKTIHQTATAIQHALALAMIFFGAYVLVEIIDSTFQIIENVTISIGGVK